MELNDNALVSWEFIREYGKFEEGQRDKVIHLINWISSKAETIAQREIISKERVIDICGNASPRIYLPVTPITEIDSIIVDNTHAFVTQALDPSEYHVDQKSGIITRYQYRWPTGFFNIRVTYTAGWTRETMPTDIQKACVEAIGTAWNRQNDESYGIQSKTMPNGVNISYEPRLSPDVFGTFAELRVGLV